MLLYLTMGCSVSSESRLYPVAKPASLFWMDDTRRGGDQFDSASSDVVRWGSALHFDKNPTLLSRQRLRHQILHT